MPIARRILLIEDDPRLGELTARYLRLHGFDVTIVREIRSDTLPYDCVVLGASVSPQDFELQLHPRECPVVTFEGERNPGSSRLRGLLERIHAAMAESPSL